MDYLQCEVHLALYFAAKTGPLCLYSLMKQYRLSISKLPYLTLPMTAFVLSQISLAEASLKTSPPSAREAAMSAMQHETFLKHLESYP